MEFLSFAGRFRVISHLLSQPSGLHRVASDFVPSATASEFCKILLDSHRNAYVPGQTVCGTVVVGVREAKKIRGIIVHCRGAAETNWTERVNDIMGYIHEVTYKAEEVYFDNEYYCQGGKYQKSLTLTPGLHTYPFAYDLPYNLPSTFKGEPGRITYFVEVVLDKPWKMYRATKQEFIVTSPLDLNFFPQLMAPSQTVVEKRLSNWYCNKKHVTVTMTIPKSGYVCGEKIPVVIRVNNRSGVELPKIILKFQQLATFKDKHLSTKPKVTMQMYEETELDPMKSRLSKIYRRSFLIPSLPSSSPNKCGIIQPRYEIYLEIQPSGLHDKIMASLPITIGTNPFKV